MLLKIFLFLFIFSNFFVFQIDGGYATAECSLTSQIATHGIHSNDFLYFSSPTFPKTLSNGNHSFPCGINLAAVEEGNRIWLAMLNGEVNHIDLIDSSFNESIYSFNSNYDFTTKLSTNSSLYFQIPENSSKQPWTAFDAVALAYDPKLNLSCPFSKQTFDFTMNPQLVIPIASDFAPNSSYTFKACNWAFTLNPTQQLKVVVKKLNPSSDFILHLFADGNIVQNFNVSVNYVSEVKYFDGKSFNLSFTNQWSNSSMSNFFMLISAVTKTNTFTQNGCKYPKINGTETIFSNIDYEIGYSKNQQCNYTISIPKNHEASFTMDENHIEMSSDILKINNLTIDARFATLPSYYTLLQASDGALLTFKSDGNTQGAGFVSTFQTYECICPESNFILKCDKQNLILPLKDNAIYCDNMNCNYNILPNSSCSNAYFYVTIFPKLRAIDSLIFKDGGNIIQNFTGYKGLYTPIYYSSKANLTFEFKSGASKNPVSADQKQWFIQTLNTLTPNFKRLNLTDSLPTNVLWLDSMIKNDAITVCSDDKNLEIFVTNSAFYSMPSYVLYDGDDLYSNIGTLDSKSIASSSPTLPRSLTSKSGCFTIYKTSDSSLPTQATVLFRKSKTNKNSCNQKDTVFQPDIYGETFEVSSANSESCEMILLDGPTGGPPGIWLTIKYILNKPNSKYTFTDLTTNKKLFELDSSEVSQWQNLGIYTTALSITVPPSSNLSLVAANSYTQSIYIQTNPQKGIMTSPRYSNSIINNVLLYSIQQQSGNNNFTANFVVKELSGSPMVQLSVDYSPKQMLSSDQHLTVTGQRFQLYYTSQNLATDNFLIEYTFQKANITSQNSSAAKTGFAFILILTFILL